jgi:hypothetical protein
MNSRIATFVLLLGLAVPVNAHHTKDHILGAPLSPVPAAASVAQNENDSASWLALGPFGLLATFGVLRWGYRRRQDKNKNAQD